MRKFLPAATAALGMLLATSQVDAATVTTNLGVRIVIQASCTVATPANLDFGTRGVLSSDVDQTTTLSVTCTNALPYSVSLNAGAGTGATTTLRKMTGPASAAINYAIYRNAARTQIWGNTIGSNTVAGTGNGSAQSITVYGRVPAQATPTAGTYTDTVGVTVTY